MNYPFKSTRLALTLLALFIFSFGYAQNNLEFYLKAARENNPIVKENLSMVEKSGVKQNIIDAEYQKPKVFMSGNVNYSPLIPNKDDPKAFGYDVAITDGGLYSCLLNVQQPIFNQPTRETLSEQNKLLGETNAEKAKRTIHQLEKDVTDRYILSCQSLNQIDFVKKLIEQLEQQKIIIEALAIQGIYKKSDILLIDISIQNQAAELNNLQAIYNRNIYLLNEMCGITGNADVKLSVPQIELKIVQEQSRFLEKFRLDSLQEVYKLNVDNLKYKPQFNLYGNTGLNAIVLSGIQRKFGVGIGIAMIIPIYDGHQKKYSKQITDINLGVITNYRNDFLIQKNNRQQAVLSDLELTEKKIQEIKSQLENYKKLLELYKIELQSGEIEIINYMNTLKSYIAAQHDLTISETNKLLTINENNFYNW